jgi:hypothetical protein
MHQAKNSKLHTPRNFRFIEQKETDKRKNDQAYDKYME